jgi:hypothetical protein
MMVGAGSNNHDPIRRPDVANSLVHFTKDRCTHEFVSNKSTIHATAFSVLQSIVSSATIRGGTGKVWSGVEVVCFTETPLAQVQHFCGAGRYAPYGVMISKRAAWAQGGRPVIYLPEDERERLFPEPQERWRVVQFDGPGSSIDYTYEREWRVPRRFDLRGAQGVFILIKDHDEIECMWEAWRQRKLFPLRNVMAIEDIRHFV